MTELLWDLERVQIFLQEHDGGDRDQVATILASEIVYDYEATVDHYQGILSFYIAQTEKDAARIAELEREVEAQAAEIKRLKKWQKDAIASQLMARGEAACDG